MHFSLQTAEFGASIFTASNKKSQLWHISGSTNSYIMSKALYLNGPTQVESSTQIANVRHFFKEISVPFTKTTNSQTIVLCYTIPANPQKMNPEREWIRWYLFQRFRILESNHGLYTTKKFSKTNKSINFVFPRNRNKSKAWDRVSVHVTVSPSPSFKNDDGEKSWEDD